MSRFHGMCVHGCKALHRVTVPRRVHKARDPSSWRRPPLRPARCKSWPCSFSFSPLHVKCPSASDPHFILPRLWRLWSSNRLSCLSQTRSRTLSLLQEGAGAPVAAGASRARVGIRVGTRLAEPAVGCRARPLQRPPTAVQRALKWHQMTSLVCVRQTETAYALRSSTQF